MSLQSGTRLGPYEIVAPIGAGGMGEVYRARDTRLDRTVAIKILPGEFAQDVKLRLRFEREAKAISSLNHPHICALYDVGPEYLVMEHCEGKTLAQRVAEGPVPFELVVEYGIQIADALEKAHKQGIIHRDVKPSNIMLTKSGVKVLDFGLAKQRIESSHEESTMAQVTEEGKILGTIRYMAPELLHGKEADARSDIFALGLVLYEMVTGKPAFRGTSKASLIAAILEREPEPLEPATPPALDRLIRACIAKDPDERIQTAHDVKLELKWMQHASEPVGIAAKRSRLLPLLAAAAIVAGVAGAFTGLRMARINRTGEIASPRSFSILVAPPSEIGIVTAYMFATSPDGKDLVYINVHPKDGIQLYKRPLDAYEATPLAGTSKGINPFFSPDGQWIAFVTFGGEGKLKKVPVTGGTPQTICDAPDVRGATWGANDTIVFGSGKGPLFAVPASGGTPRAITRIDEKAHELTHRWPIFLPDGKHVLFTVGDFSGNYQHAKVKVLDVEGGQSSVVMNDASYPRYGNGRLLFARGGLLLGAPFDQEHLRVTGPPRVVLSKAWAYLPGGIINYTVGADGSLIYLPRDLTREQNEIVLLDRAGRQQWVSETRIYVGVRFSPDGSSLLAAIADDPDSAVDYWKFEIGPRAWSRLTWSQDWFGYTAWSPDGRQVASSSNRNGKMNMFVASADFSGTPKQLAERPNWPFPTDWSPDGRWIAFMESGDQYAIELQTGHVVPVAVTRVREHEGTFSPDGKWIAFVSGNQVYVQSFPRPDRKFTVASTKQMSELHWTRSGQLVYRSDTRIMAVDIKTKPQLVFGQPRQIMEFKGVVDWDVSRDGRSFVVVRQKHETLPQREMRVVSGWTSE